MHNVSNPLIQSTVKFGEIPVIDYAVLAELRADVSEEVYPELLKLFLAQGNERVANITQAVLDDDIAELASEIHLFKGEAGAFGAIRLTKLAEMISSLCLQNEKTAVFAEAKAIKENWLMIVHELQA
jgi:HPt (histidine-containing phosphotransfer) domain-containing protein